MAKSIAICTGLGLALLLSGCNGQKPQPDPTKGIKLADLAPVAGAGTSTGPLKTMNFEVHTFDLPAENTPQLSNVWSMLYTKPLHFNNQAAFETNGFVVRFGELQMWQAVAELLQSLQAQQKSRATFLLTDNRADDLTIRPLRGQTQIFSYSAGGSLEGFTAGRGILTLRLKARKIPGARGVCNFYVKPILSRHSKGIFQSAQRLKSQEHQFVATAFSARMSPGDFLLLGPARYRSDRRFLDSLLFYRDTDKPRIRLYLFFCTTIFD